MTEMVERVARAMAAVQAPWEWEQLPEKEQELHDWGEWRGSWRDLARTAIAAMREPTEEMVEAGQDVEPEVGRFSWNAGQIWHVMIGTALGSQS